MEVRRLRPGCFPEVGRTPSTATRLLSGGRSYSVDFDPAAFRRSVVLRRLRPGCFPEAGRTPSTSTRLRLGTWGGSAGDAGGGLDSAGLVRWICSHFYEPFANQQLAPRLHQRWFVASKPADAFGKQVLFDTLILAGARAAIEEEVQHAPQLIDVYVAEPPQRNAEIGLLGQMADGTCLLEAFSKAPSLEDVRSCQRKQFAVHQRSRLLCDRRRRRPTSDPPNPSPQPPYRNDIPRLRSPDLPRLYILAAGRPRSVIRRFDLRRTTSCTPGFYFSSTVHAICLVVLDELVPDRSTIPLRLLGRGQTLQLALREALSLPDDDPLKSPLIDAITDRRQSAKAPGYVPTPEEKEFHMRLDEEIRMIRAQSVDEGRRLGVDEGRRLGVDEGRRLGVHEGRRLGVHEGRRLGVDEGRLLGTVEGRCVQARKALMRILHHRGLVPNEREHVVIESCQDLGVLESWHDRAIDADSVASVLATTVD